MKTLRYYAICYCVALGLILYSLSNMLLFCIVFPVMMLYWFVNVGSPDEPVINPFWPLENVYWMCESALQFVRIEQGVLAYNRMVRDAAKGLISAIQESEDPRHRIRIF